MTTDIPPAPQAKKKFPLWLILVIAGSLVGVLCVCVVGIGALTMLGGRVEEITSAVATGVAAQSESSGVGEVSTITGMITDAPDETETPTAVMSETEAETSTAVMSEADGDGTSKVFTSTDGRSQVTAPGDWRKMPDLNDNAELEIGASFSEKYLVVLTESDEDSADYALEEYATTIRDNFTVDLGNAIVSQPTTMTINGLSAIQYEIRGTIDETEIVYWITAIQGETNLFQVVAWTLAEEADANGDEIQQVIASFTQPSS